MSTENDTYESPQHGWTCFHCGATFMTPASARDHFGADPGAEPGCILRMQEGERPLLRRLRAAEREVARLQSDLHDETSSTRAYYAHLESQLRGYKVFRNCRSIQDVFNVYDSMEGRALAAEERLAAPTPNPPGDSYGTTVS